MKKTKLNPKHLYAIFAFLLSAVVVFCGVQIWKEYSSRQKDIDAFAELSELAEIKEPDEPKETAEPETDGDAENSDMDSDTQEEQENPVLTPRPRHSASDQSEQRLHRLDHHRQHRRGLSRDAHPGMAAEVPAHELLSAVQRLRRSVSGLPLYGRKRQPHHLRSQHAQRNHVLLSQRISERWTSLLQSDDPAGNGGRGSRVHHLCGCLCR